MDFAFGKSLSSIPNFRSDQRQLSTSESKTVQFWALSHSFWFFLSFSHKHGVIYGLARNLFFEIATFQYKNWQKYSSKSRL